MEGYSDSAFRRVCKSVNPEIVTYTEFTSADGIHFNAEKMKRKLWFHPSEQPVLAQIFGKNVDTFISATKLCEDMGFTGIDINMGCPSKKVVKSEHGVALRKKPDLAYRLIEAVATNTTLPVSVKTRLGWDNAEDLIAFGIGAQNAGADMICIHGRTYQQPYKVEAQWDPLYALKDAISIPVLGNGGIESLSDGFAKLNNLDGIVIGQATFGNPWIFSKEGKPKNFADRLPLILDHAQWLIAHKGELVGCREIRKHLLAYVKGVSGAKKYKQKLSTVDSFHRIKGILQEILDNISDLDSQTQL